ncbi:MAG TPA: VOC family protein [Candidatus Tectomicrobia bacterium]|jgi:catechol-2,3-dioxygenase
MAKINKVGHVVLNVRNIDASVAFYTQALGMELMVHHQERHMAFLSFGTQHHDIALFQAPEGAQSGGLGINHIAMQIEGGKAELQQLYGRLLTAGARIDRTTEHSGTLSVYFFDPDGNRLEIFAEKFSPEEGMRVIREGGGVNKPLALEPSFV